MHTNLANAIIEPSICAAEEFISTQHPAIQYVCNNHIRDTTLTYHDTFQGNNEPPLSEPEVNTRIAVRMIGRNITNALADKVKFGRAVKEHSLLDYSPQTYFSKEEAIGSAGDPERLLFVKLRSGTRGENVVCVKHKELNTVADFKDTHIIQEGIQNPVLYYGRKVVFRYYIFIFNKKIFISRHSGLIVHGDQYDPTVTDYKVHVQHNGKDSQAIRLPLEDIPNGKWWMDRIKETTTAFLPVLEAARRDSSLFRYLIIGADGIPCIDNKVRLIEMNTHPAMVKPPLVDRVYVPVFSSMMLMTVAGINNGTWIQIV